MVDRIVLIRHGATEGDGKKRYKGRLDVPLSAEGERQLALTATHIKKLSESMQFQVDAIYCSDLIRAQRSAEIISAEIGSHLIIERGLRERDFGAWEGMTFDEIELKYPGEFEAWANDPLMFSPIDGESTLQLSQRVEEALARIMSQHAGKTICIVAHGGVNRSVLCHYMQLPLQHIFKIEQDFACVNIIEIYDGFPVVKLLNGGPGK